MRQLHGQYITIEKHTHSHIVFIKVNKHVNNKQNELFNERENDCTPQLCLEGKEHCFDKIKRIALQNFERKRCIRWNQNADKT